MGYNPSSTGAKLGLSGSTSGLISQFASASTVSYSIHWPAAQAASSGYSLTNDGAGNLSWSAPAASGANTSLSNLSATAVNVDLVPNGSGINLGSAAIAWSNAYIEYLLSFTGAAVMSVFNRVLHDSSGGGVVTFASGFQLNQLTASTVPYLDVSKKLVSSAITPTQLGYLSGASGTTGTGNVVFGLSPTITTPNISGNISIGGSVTSGTWLGTAIDATHGGTAQTSWTTGDILYASGSNTLSKLPIGTNGTFLKVVAGVPVWSTGSSFTPVAPTSQEFLSGSGTYTTPTSPAPLYIEVTIVGGGGGGGPGRSSSAAGGNGGNSTFGASLTAGGGIGGVIGGGPAAGGTNTVSVGTSIGSVSGGSSQGSIGTVAGATAFPCGGMGGSNPKGGAGGGAGYASGNGGAGVANTGGGGGGGGVDSIGAGADGGAGGGAGGLIKVRISSISATYAYSVGAAGTAGTSATGRNGGAGGSGYILVEEFYQ